MRARCRHCKQRISGLYPAVELSVAILWVAVYATFGLTATAAVFAYLAPVCVALFVIDLQAHRLPHRIVVPSYAVVAILTTIAWVLGERTTWWSALVGLVAMGGFYGLLWLIYPKGMGFGDVTTAGLLGFAAGFLSYSHLAVAAIAGPLVGGVVVLALALARKLRKGQAVPYGPALIGGAWIGYLWAPAIAAWYLGIVGLA